MYLVVTEVEKRKTVVAEAREQVADSVDDLGGQSDLGTQADTWGMTGLGTETGQIDMAVGKLLQVVQKALVKIHNPHLVYIRLVGREKYSREISNGGDDDGGGRVLTKEPGL